MTLPTEQLEQAFADRYWLSLRNESIFMTGGSGLFGRWFTQAFIDANKRLGLQAQLTILSRNPVALVHEHPELFGNHAVTLIQGDVTSFLFPKGHYSSVLHMATTSAAETFQGEDQLAKFTMLTKGTERVLQFAAACGAKKVLFTSSGVAYGATQEGMQHIPESYNGAPDTTSPSSALAQGKRAAEFLCAYYADKYQFEYTVARCFSFVGPGLPLDIHYAIGNFIRDALHSDALTVKGDGSPVRSFLYLGDLVTWLLTLLVAGTSGCIYNVGSDHAISVLQLAQLIRDLLAPSKQVVVLGNSDHTVGNFGRNCYVPDISRARTELKLDVWTPLTNAILNTASYKPRHSVG